MLTIDEALTLSQELTLSTLKTSKVKLGQVTSYLSDKTGKGLRSHLLITCASNPEGLVHPDAAKAAAAIEILHLATLIHDDVIDDSDTRRGHPSVHKQFDTKTAVICGDYLLAVSLSLLSDIDHTRLDAPEAHKPLAPKMINALSSLAKGEFLQHLNIGNVDIDFFTYLKIISGKTAALFYLAAYTGAFLANETPKDCKHIGTFGQFIGMAFQISDDCKDYEWSIADAGKPVTIDAQNGVMSLPVILAIQKDATLKPLLKTLTPATLPHFIQQVIALGGTSSAVVISKKYAKKAEKQLTNLEENKKKRLLALTKRLRAGV